jgi:hypothetical protein
MAIQEAEELELAPTVDEGLAHLIRLIERDKVEGARAFVKALEGRWPDHPHVRHFAHVLAPPVARTVNGERLPPLDRERDWIRANATQYPGCWLALHGDRLIAADPSLKEVLARKRAEIGETPALLWWQPPAEDAG